MLRLQDELVPACDEEGGRLILETIVGCASAGALVWFLERVGAFHDPPLREREGTETVYDMSRGPKCRWCGQYQTGAYTGRDATVRSRPCDCSRGVGRHQHVRCRCCRREWLEIAP